MLRHVAVLLILAAPGIQAADGESVEAAVKAVYETLSGPAGARDWVRFRALFADGARMIPMRKAAAGGSAPVVLTVEQFIERVTPNAAKQGFYESEVSSRKETYGNIAHVFSAYESRHERGEAPFTRGVNSLQLARVNGVWKVVSVLWDSE